MPIIIWLITYPAIILYFSISPWILSPLFALSDLILKLLVNRTLLIVILQGQGHPFQWAFAVLIMHLALGWGFYWVIQLFR